MSRPPAPKPRSASADRPAEPRPLATGHLFGNPALLAQALTHSSLAHEQPSLAAAEDQRPADNEQLEFLGDAVLSLAVADALFEHFPAAREGDLTRLRASLVSREHLASVATRLHLGAHLRLGRGEDQSGGRSKPALLADALEAVIAAIYLDGGFPSAAAFIRREIVQPALPELRQALTRRAAIGDFKTALQEHVQALGLAQPRYVLVEESGLDHQRRFRVAVEIDEPGGSPDRLAEAEGSTKKRAQQDAARLALDLLESRAAATGHPSPAKPSGAEP